MEEIIDAVNFEIQNSGYADKLAAGVVITGGGAMLKHLPQLMKFKTAMDVRIGYPNEHLAGTARNEINQPMYATSVGLIMRGFEFLDTYKKTFDASEKNEYIPPKKPVTPPVPETSDINTEEPEMVEETYHDEDKIPTIEKIKGYLSRMFEVEDQPIK
jgi:cell division protein FtsA